ncbi:MAG: hypothetical protein ACC634_05230 [Hyphomicrobiales bacterium]
MSIELNTLDTEGVMPGGADVVLTDIAAVTNGNAIAAMQGFGRIFYVVTTVSSADEAATARKATRFVDWLLADVGQRTIEQFKRDGKQVFKRAANVKKAPVQAELTGDRAVGETLSYNKCGRCHVIGEKNRLKGIGSTPSFAVVRTIADWRLRFETFFTRNPHPSFTQIPDVTPPFDATRPPPIRPMALTLDELDDILAFAATIKPADLGAPIKHQ